MKQFNKSYAILAAGIFILIFSILLGSSIASQYIEINGPYKTSKISARVLDDTGQQENSAFTQEDMKHLQEFSFKGLGMAYSSEDSSQVSYDDNQSEAHVYGVSERYDMFHQTRLKSGSFITPGNQGGMVAVVDESLADALFNNTNVVGMYVELYGRKFKIIGVIESDDSIIQALTDSGYGSIYIPVEHMLKLNTNAKIGSLEVRAADDGTTGKNIQAMSDALSSIGKSISDYKITDYNVEKLLLEEKGLFCILLPGIGVIFLLLLIVRKRAISIYKLINSTLRENYFKDVLRLEYRRLGIAILESAAALLLAYLIWSTVKFRFYLPAEYIPDELIDTVFFSNLIKSLVHSKVKNVGYIPSFTEMKANVLSIMQGWNLAIDIFIGLPLFFLGLKLTSTDGDGSVKHLIYSCIFLVLSIGVCLLILDIAGMPPVVSTKGMLVVLTLIFLLISGYENENIKE